MEKNSTCFQPIYDHLLVNVKSLSDLKKVKPDDLPELRDYQYLLTRLLAYSELYGRASERLLDLRLKAFSTGTVVAVKVPDIKFEYDMPYHKAAEYFKGLDLIDPITFYGNLERYAGSAFTISYVSTVETLEKAQAYIANSLGSGKVNPEAMKAAIQGFVTSNGDDPLHPWHLETVVRTNLNSAFSKGRYLEQLDSPNEYWQYFATVDGRETPLCNSLDGKVFSKTDPFWSTNYPPNHFNCRSTVVTADAQTLKSEGLKAEKDMKKYLDKVGRAFPKLKKFLQPGRGFSNNPAMGLEKWLAGKTKELGIDNVDSAAPVFGSVEEGINYINGQYGIEFVNKGMCKNVEVVQALADSLNKTYGKDKYGVLVNRIRFYENKDNILASYRGDSKFERVVNINLYCLNHNYGKDFKWFEKGASLNAEKYLQNHGYRYTVRVGLESDLIHEFAHDITYNKIAWDDKTTRNVLQGDVPGGLPFVSNYGQKNLAEYLAESWSAWFYGEKLTNSQLDLLRNWEMIPD